MKPTMVPAILGEPADLESLTHNAGNAATGGIWRVRGPGGTAVAKLARPPVAAGEAPVGTPGWQTSDEPTHWNYWRREYLAYTTGLARTAYGDAGIVGARLVAAHDRADGAVELWFADHTGDPGMSWPVERLARFAYQLGAGQARWVGAVPDTPWLSRGWLAQYLDARRIRVPTDEEWNHPAAAAWSPAVRATLRRLWYGRRHALAVVDAAPRTLCHLDVWPMNLIEDGDTSILLDWSFVGEGAVGEDIANLVIDSVTDGMMPVDRLQPLAVAAVDAYVAGLRDGGYTGSPDVVRRSVMASAVAKYSWFGPAVLSRVIAGGTFGHATYGQDRSGDEAIVRLTGVVELIASWASEILDAGSFYAE